MRLPGVCDRCLRTRQVNVSGHGLVMLFATRVAHGVCDDCQEKERLPRTVTCPDCGATSYNKTDIETGWCALCERFTGKTLPEVRQVLARLQRRGDPASAGVARRLTKQETETRRTT